MYFIYLFIYIIFSTAIFENEIKLQEVAQTHSGIGSALQDRAKKSVERLTTFGAAVRNHLQENPFMRNTQDTNSLNRATPAASSSSLHPSLVRGQQVHASTNPPQRRAKPLPPIPAGASSSAFPPDISTNPPLTSASPWDAFNDNTEPLNPNGRPKSATVTSISPSTHNPVNAIVAGLPHVSLPHSNSTNSLAMPSSPLPPNTNVFEFSPFDVDHTPATPAPSISNTRAPDWFSPELVAGKLAAVSTNDPLNPFFTPSSPQLPPVSMKPLNPFVENANHAGNDQGAQDDEREGTSNIFTSFSLDALAPPDMANVHSPSLPASSYHSTSGGYFEAPAYGSPSSGSGAYISKSGGTMPNYNTPAAAAGGTVPNYSSAVDSSAPGGFTNGTSPSKLDPYLAARVMPARSSSSNDISGGYLQQHQIQQQQQQFLHQQQTQPQQIPPQQQHPDEGDDFDSFLAARIKQM